MSDVDVVLDVSDVVVEVTVVVIESDWLLLFM